MFWSKVTHSMLDARSRSKALLNNSFGVENGNLVKKIYIYNCKFCGLLNSHESVLDPTQGVHILGLVFCSDQDESDLKVAGVFITPLSWTDHLSVRFQTYRVANSHRCVIVRPKSWRQLDLDGFLVWGFSEQHNWRFIQCPNLLMEWGGEMGIRHDHMHQT